MKKSKFLLSIVFGMVFGSIYAKDDTPIDSTVFVVGYNYRVCPMESQ